MKKNMQKRAKNMQHAKNMQIIYRGPNQCAELSKFAKNLQKYVKSEFYANYGTNMQNMHTGLC